MNDALKKVDTTLSERYMVCCTSCYHERHLFGMKAEARAEAERNGWEFRGVFARRDGEAEPSAFERAYCPHCRLLVKP